MISQTDLKTKLNYDPESGEFVWVDCFFKSRIGRVAGWVDKSGYVRIRISGNDYRAHRLAFIYMTGEVPKCCDHINRIKDDNRWLNLREATVSQNQMNTNISSKNKSGYRGVFWRKDINKWKSSIKVNGKLIVLGYYDCPIEAHDEYVRNARKHFGEFFNSN